MADIVAAAAEAKEEGDDELARVRAQLRPARAPYDWPQRPGGLVSSSHGSDEPPHHAKPGDGAGATEPPPLPAQLRTDVGRITRVPEAAARALTPSEFQRRFERVSEPAVLDGLMRDWPALPGRSQPVASADSGGGDGSSGRVSGDRAWTPANLVRRFGGDRFECGVDAAGGDVHVTLRTYAEHYARRYRDRNPFVVFDAVVIDVQSLGAAGGAAATAAAASDTTTPAAVSGAAVAVVSAGATVCDGSIGAAATAGRRAVVAPGWGTMMPAAATPRPGARAPAPLLFLDVDGVLNRTTRATHVRVDADLVERLATILRRTGASVVFSTFWREFQKYLTYVLRRHGIDALIAGATLGAPTATRRYGGDPQSSRADEIEQFLAWQPGPRPPYVILDDRDTAAASPEQRARFVKTTASLGLTDTDVEKAVAIVQRQQREYGQAPAAATAGANSVPPPPQGGQLARGGPLGPDHLSRDFAPPGLFAADDFLRYLGEGERPPWRWFIYGVAGSGSPCHTDPMGTAAWNALAYGRKRWVMFHPSTPAALLRTSSLDAAARRYGGGARAGEQVEEEQEQAEEQAEQAEEQEEQANTDSDWEDLWGWFENLPNIRRRVRDHFASRRRPPPPQRAAGSDTVAAINEIGIGSGGWGSGGSGADDNGDEEEEEEWWYRDFVQEPGQVVFVPSAWHHAVLNLTPHTIAVTQNYCSRENLSACLALMDDAALAARFRTLVQERHPELTV